MVRGISHNITQVNKELLRKKRHQRGRCCYRSFRPKEQTRMANKNRTRAPGEKEPRVRSVWLRHPIPADKVRTGTN